MRERRNDFNVVRRIDGITPARAGKTPRFLCPTRPYWDHPRSCGKDHICSAKVYSRLGSPPLVRERPIGLLIAAPHNRITPARAGKTEMVHDVFEWARDHPRSCGKDLHCRSSYSRQPGSPPLVRERRHKPAILPTPARITPARAGKT